MHLIIGLGNPTQHYALTRHNIGFQALDALVRSIGCDSSFTLKKKINAEVCECASETEKLILIKPQTYMNNSGEAIAAVFSYYKIDLSCLFIVYDDIALPFGKLRIRGKGSSGGHKGIESIIRHLKSKEFVRFRIGIGCPDRMDAADYVLERFSPEQKKQLPHILETVSQAIQYALLHGVEKAMSTFNPGGAD